MNIKLNNLEIVPIPARKGLLGFCSFTLNNAFYLSDIGIHSCLSDPSKIRLVYPVKRLSNGSLLPIIKPISKDIQKYIEKLVSKEWGKLFNNE